MIISPSSRPKPGRTSLDSFSSIALNAHDEEDGGHIDVDGDETAIETTRLPQPFGDFGKSLSFNNVSELWTLDIKVTLTAWMISFSNLSSIPSLSFFTPIPSFLHIDDGRSPFLRCE